MYYIHIPFKENPITEFSAGYGASEEQAHQDAQEHIAKGVRSGDYEPGTPYEISESPSDAITNLYKRYNQP